jgi:hypothetical protein
MPYHERLYAIYQRLAIIVMGKEGFMPYNGALYVIDQKTYHIVWARLEIFLSSAIYLKSERASTI